MLRVTVTARVKAALQAQSRLPGLHYPRPQLFHHISPTAMGRQQTLGMWRWTCNKDPVNDTPQASSLGRLVIPQCRPSWRRHGVASGNAPPSQNLRGRRRSTRKGMRARRVVRLAYLNLATLAKHSSSLALPVTSEGWYEDVMVLSPPFAN